MRQRISQSEYEALAAFRYALRRFLRFSKELLARQRLTPEQYEAMLALAAFAGENGLVIRDLSERLQVKHHTAVSLIDKLVRRKLFSRTRAAADRRHVYVRLTARGAILLRKLASVHRVEVRRRSSELIAALRRIQK